MSNFITRLFTFDHLKQPFTIKQDSLSPNSILRTDTNEPIKVSKGKQAITYALSIFSGAFSLGIAAVPVFFLASSLAKSVELKQRKINLTKQPGDLTKVPNPFNSGKSGADSSVPNPFYISKPKPNEIQPEPDIPNPNPAPSINPPPSDFSTDFAKLPPPPASGIKVGLPNLANTCWLNAAMKFMSSTNVYDSILNGPTDTLDQQNLQDILKQYVAAIRSDPPRSLDLAYMGILEEEVRTLMNQDHLAGTGGQMDATEFFLSLQRFFGYQPELDFENPNLLQGIFTYESKANRAPFASDPETIVKISLPYDEAIDNSKKVDLSKAILKEDTRELTLPGGDHPVAVKTKEYPANLPENLTINFPRVIGMSDGRGHQLFNDDGTIKQIRLNKPIDLGKNGQFELVQYKEIETSNQSTTIVPEKKGTYQLVGAILHSGSDRGGHYTEIEYTQDGQYLFHNDSSISVLTPQDAINRCENNAVLLRFKRVGESELTLEDAQRLMAE